jgi:beta-glucosidase-like glycosyl hydrolase
MTSRRDMERMIGAVLAPEVRSPGTIASASEVVPSREYLERFPPAMVVAFGRTPAGAVSPTPQLERVRAVCRELGNAEPLVACDLEQGAGLHFAEGTRLPPALALASAELARHGAHATIDDLSVIVSAGSLTGVEARSLGVDLVLAPVADVNTRGDNPIIAVRSFGDDPQVVAVFATGFALSLRVGAAACAKHFPGHGDTSQDSHIELPRVDRDARGLREVEFVPFRALIRARVEAIMIGHIDVPALTGERGVPCTLSRRALEGVLRDELGFTGVILSDAMNMGALAKQKSRYARALAAGCDGLLCPHDAAEAALEIEAALASGELEVARLSLAAERMRALCRQLRSKPATEMDAASLRDRRSGCEEFASLALRVSDTSWPWDRFSACAVLDPFPASESPEVRACVERLRERCGGGCDGPRLILPIVCEVRAWGGRYGLDRAELAALEARVYEELARGRDIGLVWFGSPQTLPHRLWNSKLCPIVLAFAPTPPMFDAVGAFLRPHPGERPAMESGSLPAKLG